MAKIILTFNKRVIREYPFVKDSLTIGRKPDNDIIIENVAVSGSHARIDRVGSNFILTDLQSTNGTYVNNKKVESYTLTHGNYIVIGKHVLMFLESEEERTAAAQATKKVDPDKTMILDTATQRDLLAKQTTAPPPARGQKVGVLSLLDGSQLPDIELIKKLTRVGKSDNCEVRLSGMFMTATAATISRRPSGYVITFAGGRAKLKVNGEVISGSVPLKDFDTIEIGSYKFQFYQKEANG